MISGKYNNKYHGDVVLLDEELDNIYRVTQGELMMREDSEFVAF